MTQQARIVLQDCREALRELTDDTMGPQWRRRWVTTLVLLRTVGYVLDKVDGQRDAATRRAVDDWWADIKRGEKRSPPEPTIFWEFIDKERHNAVKEYSIGAGHDTTIPWDGRPEHTYWVRSGHYAGQPQAVVVNMAIQWWERQLDAIEAAVV